MDLSSAPYRRPEKSLRNRPFYGRKKDYNITNCSQNRTDLEVNFLNTLLIKDVVDIDIASGLRPHHNIWENVAGCFGWICTPVHWWTLP